MQHCQGYNACSSDYRNTITSYSTYQAKIWSWQTDYLGFNHKKNLPIELHQNIQNFNFNSNRLNMIKDTVKRDPMYSTIHRMTLNDWSKRIQDVPHLACNFWSIRDELTVEEGVLLKGNGICIPPELHDRTLYELHNSHQGIKKMTHIVRANVYWPSINADIANYTKRCTICAKYKASQTVQPMLPCDIPVAEVSCRLLHSSW